MTIKNIFAIIALSAACLLRLNAAEHADIPRRSSPVTKFPAYMDIKSIRARTPQETIAFKNYRCALDYASGMLCRGTTPADIFKKITIRDLLALQELLAENLLCPHEAATTPLGIRKENSMMCEFESPAPILDALFKRMPCDEWGITDDQRESVRELFFTNNSGGRYHHIDFSNTASLFIYVFKTSFCRCLRSPIPIRWNDMVRDYYNEPGAAPLSKAQRRALELFAHFPSAHDCIMPELKTLLFELNGMARTGLSPVGIAAYAYQKLLKINPLSSFNEPISYIIFNIIIMAFGYQPVKNPVSFIQRSETKAAEFITFCAQCSQSDAPMMCGKCQCARYCDIDCQRANWKSHKFLCVALPE